MFMNKKSIRKRSAKKTLCSLLRVLSRPKDGSAVFSGNLKSIVILASERFGDTILLTVLIRQIRQLFPDVRLDVVTFRRTISDFLANDKHIDRVFYSKSGYASYLKHLLATQYDVLFNPKDSVSFNFILQSKLIQARFKVAHRHQYHEGLYDHLIDLDYYTHVSLRNSALLDVLVPGSSVRNSCRPYLPPMAVSEAVHDFIFRIADAGCVGVNISAGHAHRYWGQSNWISLISRYPGETFIVFAAPCDIVQKEAIESECGNVMVSPFTNNLYEAGLITEKLKILVTPDTSFVHVAACYNTPLVGLYRNRIDDRTRFSPLSDSYELVISSSEKVSDISVDDVDSSMHCLFGKLT